MMLARRLLYRKRSWRISYNCTAVREAQSANQLLDTINLELRLPAPLTKKPQRQPFAKNLFLGVFDHEFMYYPEPQTKERHQQFFEWLKPIEGCMSDSLADPGSASRDDVLARLKDLGAFRANISEQYLGLNLSLTELARLVEATSCLPWLGTYVVKNHIAPTRIISVLCSDEQKARYLPKITSGEVVPAVCFTEAANGVNMRNINTKAVLSACDNHWILDGEKSFVVNGHNSNLFLVFAHCGDTYMSINKTLSVFLVERDSDGITYRDIKKLVGQQNSPVCTVIFKDVKVPKENLVAEVGAGVDILIDSLAPGNRHVAAQAVGLLKAFTKLLTTHILQRKHLDQNLHECEAIQGAIGKIATTLYGMESMLYMTTGMIDMFENQDCTLEKAMTEAYCTNECVKCIYEGMQIIGAQSYLRENVYIQMLEDALAYTLFDCYNVDSSMYISLIGLQHTGKHMREHILKLRNPFQFPRHVIRWVTGKEYRLKFDIAEHMHPSLQSGGKILEQCITKLVIASLTLLERHGAEIASRQMELCRLSEMATRTFALVSVLSRTSRAYCIGLRNAEQDRQVAGSFSILTLDRINVLADEIAAGDWDNGDRLYKDVAELMYSKKDYFAEHPLSRTY